LRAAGAVIPGGDAGDPLPAHGKQPNRTPYFCGPSPCGGKASATTRNHSLAHSESIAGPVSCARMASLLHNGR